MMGTLRLLVAGQHEMLLRALVSFLSLYDDLDVVGTASSAGEMLTRAYVLRPDVVLVDLRLCGQETLSQLRAVLPRPRIVVISLYDGDLYSSRALAAGADAFVALPNVAADLIPTIRRTWRAAVAGCRCTDRGNRGDTGAGN